MMILRPGKPFVVFDGRAKVTAFPNLIDAIDYAKRHGFMTIRQARKVVWRAF